MNTNQLTIDQAAELVKSSIGDVFSREAVLSIIERIKVPEVADMVAVRQMIADHKMTICHELEARIEDNFQELVDYDEAEFRIENNKELVVNSVGFSTRDYVFRDLAEGIIEILLEGCNEMEYDARMRAEDIVECLTPNTTSDESSKVCE